LQAIWKRTKEKSMLWQGQRESGNVIDQRAFGGKSLGLGGLAIGAVIYYLMGGNPLVYVAENAGQVRSSTAAVSPQDESRKKFAAVVLADTEDVWKSVFASVGKTYRDPSMVLFRGAVRSACGRASSAMGPFYCPEDQRVYLDLGFFDQLARLGGKGDFAGAYVIAHEVGHHVQTLLGIAGPHTNQGSVKMELQADCLAGVWAKQTQAQKNVIEAGDIEEAQAAAAAVGDDRLQQRSQGEVVPDSFTHGSSAQRVAAFEQGFGGGRLNDCMRE
jgi:predicted metalloprotease